VHQRGVFLLVFCSCSSEGSGPYHNTVGLWCLTSHLNTKITTIPSTTPMFHFIPEVFTAKGTILSTLLHSYACLGIMRVTEPQLPQFPPAAAHTLMVTLCVRVTHVPGITSCWTTPPSDQVCSTSGSWAAYSSRSAASQTLMMSLCITVTHGICLIWYIWYIW